MPRTRATRTPKGTTAMLPTERRRAVTHPVRLTPGQCRWVCDHRQFRFASTAELTPLNGIVGQHRAVEAIELGAEILSRGFNIFVMSLLGTGRLTTVQSVLTRVMTRHRPLVDYAYVHNFKHPDMPRLLTFEAGGGTDFARAMEANIRQLRQRMQQHVDSPAYRRSRNRLLEKYRQQEQQVAHRFDRALRRNGFALGQSQREDGSAEPEILVRHAGKTHPVTALEGLVAAGKMTARQADKLLGKYAAFRNELPDVTRRQLLLGQEFRQALQARDRRRAGAFVREIFADERRTFTNPEVLEYLEECEADLLENLEIFTVLPSGDAQEQMLPSGMSVGDKLLHYTVNVVLDNADTTEPPVLIETYPTYVNLFGTIEKKMDKHGYVKTDFTQIKAGALLRADGGYLIVNAADLLHDDAVWQNLKRLLLYGRLEIQAPDAGLLSHSALKPKHIDSTVKVIMLGDYDTYMKLYEHEPDFRKMFKIPAEFDYETDRGPKMIENYARFIARVCSEESLPHANPQGVAAIVEWAVAQTEDKDKITINFSEVADLIREAAFFASKDGRRRIDRRYVERAIQQRQRRTELQDHKIQSQIVRGTVLIDTAGHRAGQINGLTVYSTGLISFGKPARISVTTGAGTSGLVNIEREADFSGNVHTKGVHIIGGLLRWLFAQRRPLALTATIAFEQNYGEVDGDSASAAEMYALLSSLSGVPVHQSIACTGSINQMGDIQPVGGVNEKIKGFFEICATRGLTGSQGVIIPAQNVVDLMLDERIIAAIRARTFHIYPITRLEEGAEILMEMPAGVMRDDYTYPEGTLFHKVDQRLEELYAVALRWHERPA